MSQGVSDVELPSWAAAANARSLVAPVLRTAYRLLVSGVDQVPVEGPLLMVANHPGGLDEAALVGTSPRPVHVLTDAGTWPPPLDRLAGPLGAITIARVGADRLALHAAAAAIDDGRAVAMFPDVVVGGGGVSAARPGVGYVLARTGAPVLPVALLGTGGRHPTDPPRPRSTVVVAFGAPVMVPVDGVDPVRRADVLRLAERVRQVLADHVRGVVERTGRTLPAPVAQDGGTPA